MKIHMGSPIIIDNYHQSVLTFTSGDFEHDDLDDLALSLFRRNVLSLSFIAKLILYTNESKDSKIRCPSHSRFECRVAISIFLKTIYCIRVIWICLFWHLINVNSRHPAAIPDSLFTQRLWSIIRESPGQNCIPRSLSQGNKFSTKPVPDYIWSSYIWHTCRPCQASVRLELPVQ